MKKFAIVFLSLAACFVLFAPAAVAQPEPPCDPCVTYCSYTQGGWGAPCNGGNAGCLRDMCFDAVYPNGVTIGRNYPGGCCWIHFTSASAIEEFLPQGSTATPLTQNYTDPGVGNITVFAGQVLALQLNVDLGDYGCGQMVPIGDMIIAMGPFAGWTIDAFLAAANDVLGGGTPPDGFDIGDFNDAANALNNNFDNCYENDGYVETPFGAQTDYVNVWGEWFPTSVCLSFTPQCDDICLVWWCPYACDEANISDFSWVAGCMGPDCIEECTPSTGGLELGDQIIIEPDPNGGCWWYMPVHATAPGCFCLTWEFQLPVNLVSFDVAEGNGEVRVVWTTATESGNDYFEIMRDNVKMAEIDARGSEASGANYVWTDNSVVSGTTYNYQLVAVDDNGARTILGADNATPNSSLPVEYTLYQNYPNPFNPSTSIAFDLVESGFVSLKVYNMIGQEVATLVSGVRSAGQHVVSFDASNLPSALYLYRIEVNGFEMHKKMLLIK